MTAETPPSPSRLLEPHAEMLASSSLTEEVVRERGYRSVTARSELLALGFGARQASVPALLIPLYGVDGRLVGYAVRPDEPRVIDGRVLKYEEPKGGSKRLDVPPRCQRALGNPAIPLYVTEGAKKADALAARGACAVNISGVWAWRGTNQYGGKVALPDWDSIALNERLVRIAFDSDVVTKPAVRLALVRLKAFLESRGAIVEIVDLMPSEGVAKQGIDDFFASGGSFAEIEALCRSEIADVPDAVDELRPAIVVTDRFMHDIAQDCWTVLGKWNDHKPFAFQREGQLVSVQDDDSGSPYVREWTRDDLAFTLDRIAQFVRERRSDDGVFTVPGRLPEDVSRDMLATWAKPVPILRGVTGTPAFAPDGSLSVEPGYQPNSRLYYRPAGLPVPPVPEVPSADEVAHARSLLLGELLVDFPFADQASRPNALGALLTPVVRELIEGPTPLHAIDAPTPGSGKGLLTEVIAFVTSGRPAGVTSLPRSDDELRKRITAMLRDATPVILFDNISRELDSPTLAAAITSTVWSDRVLGSTLTGRYPNRSLWIGTGNNLRVSGELVRRIVQIRIDPRIDRPWERSGFRHDPLLVWVRERRHEVVWALLVLVRHWMAVGRPAWTGKPMGSFESWCQTVGGILEAAGIEGFLGNRDDLYRQADAESDEWRDFTVTWWERFGGQPVQTADLFPLLSEGDLLPSLFRNTRGEQSERASRTRLGMAIAARRDRAFGSLFIRERGSDSHRKGKLFVLEPAEGIVTDPTGSAEVPPTIAPFVGSQRRHAEPAEPVLDSDREQGSPAPIPSRDGDAQSSPIAPFDLPQVPPSSRFHSTAGAKHAEPEVPAGADGPWTVPQSEAAARQLAMCPGGCGSLVPPGQKCSPCAAAAVDAWLQKRDQNSGKSTR
ncbi:MAG: DUF3854 domain-containing protein [Dehalococcoidia bacterium]|nr:DUF3854 domain-containing protein [Dehalococcoidia bacterium]